MKSWEIFDQKPHIFQYLEIYHRNVTKNHDISHQMGVAVNLTRVQTSMQTSDQT